MFELFRVMNVGVFELFRVMNVGVTMRAMTSQHKSGQYNTLRS